MAELSATDALKASSAETMQAPQSQTKTENTKLMQMKHLSSKVAPCTELFSGFAPWAEKILKSAKPLKHP